MCCDSWGHKESDTTERLNWTELTNTHHLRPQRPTSQGEQVVCKVTTSGTSLAVQWLRILPSSAGGTGQGAKIPHGQQISKNNSSKNDHSVQLLECLSIYSGPFMVPACSYFADLARIRFHSQNQVTAFSRTESKRNPLENNLSLMWLYLQ